jgi:arylsulfatase
VHVPLVAHWPARITDAGGIRDQFHHVNDIAPTVYELLQVTAPDTYRGYEQLPVTGTSMAYSFDAPGAPTRKPVQYFEMIGHRGLWHDGWKAVCRHTPGTSFDDDPWELYHVEVDRSECHDLAAEMPEKLAEMIALWWREAEANGVLPLDDRGVELFGARFADRTPHPADRHYVYYPPVSPIPPQAAATIGGRTFQIAATIDRPTGANGVLFATGTENSGLSLFIDADRLVFDYNAFGAHTLVTSNRPVPVGQSTVGVDFQRLGRHGTATVLIDGEPCGTADIAMVMRMMSSASVTLGADLGSAVSDAYAIPNEFTGTIVRVDVQLAPERAKQAAANAVVAEAAENARQ